MGEPLTILDALREKSQGFLSDDSLQLVCIDRGLDWGDDYVSLEEKDRDLLLGQLYFALYNVPTGGTTEKVSDGGWSHSESKQMSNADSSKWARLHRMYFTKWGLEPLIPFSGVRLLNF